MNSSRTPERASSRPLARPADLAACREMIRVGSRSFHTASLFLPDGAREASYALYGFCRLSDDAVDMQGGDADTVAKLRHRLCRIYAGNPFPAPVDRALADAVRRFSIPQVLLEALLEGLEWDAAGRRYETLSDVRAYAARVAGSVGGMMATLMGERSPNMVSRACDLGVAMQLTNIARDVGEDARIGRLYLPREWMREAGIDPDAFLAAPEFSPELAAVIARLLAEADRLYRRADGAIARLDPSFRPAIHVARRLYDEIGLLLARRGLDSVRRRTSVSAARKLWLLLGAIREAMTPRLTVITDPPLAETAFLVEAVERETAETQGAHRGGPRGPSQDLIWTLELFATLGGRERLGRTAAP